jgi:hypothetical protein
MKALSRRRPIVTSSTSPIRRWVSLGFSGLRHMGGAIVRFLAGGSEVRIWQTRTRNGELQWHAYDPNQGHGVTLSSEAEMRAWLEQRYRF